MRFNKFPTDILLKILSFCRVVDALKIEMTSKHLQDVVSIRSVWLYFWRNADLEHAPQISQSHSADELTDEELRDHVVRAVRGHYNWSSVNPRVTSTIKMKVGGRPKRLRFPTGRRHLIGYLQRDGGHIHCWDLSEEKQGQSMKYAWQAAKRKPPINMTCQYTNDRTSLMVAYCVLITNTQLLIEVVEFNFRKNLPVVRCTKTVEDTLGSRRRKICMRGPFVVVATRRHFIFVNWETGVMVFASVAAFMSIFDIKVIDGSLLFVVFRVSAVQIAVNSDVKLAIASLSDIFSQATTGKSTMQNIDVFLSTEITIDMSVIMSHSTDTSCHLKAVTLHGLYVPSSVPGNYNGKEELIDTISVLSSMPSTHTSESRGSYLIAHIICLVKDKETQSLSFIRYSCSQPYQLPVYLWDIDIQVSKSGRILYFSESRLFDSSYHALTLASLWSGNPGGLLQSKRVSGRSRIVLDYNSGAICHGPTRACPISRKGYVPLKYYD
ncbi:hypothetical protein DFH11DRAFT_1316927 [Phellopilus nigrolimitatus]|nr:hypothetical protein DFH11DRAFT_1316927 [Phellopilus nigrolimitatus]